MAVETGAVFIGFMLAAYLGAMLLRMAFQTEEIGTHHQEMFVITGMGSVALAAVALHNRPMDGLLFFIEGLMTRKTKGIRRGWRLDAPSLVGLVAGETFATCHGLME